MQDGIPNRDQGRPNVDSPLAICPDTVTDTISGSGSVGLIEMRLKSQATIPMRQRQAHETPLSRLVTFFCLKENRMQVKVFIYSFLHLTVWSQIEHTPMQLLFLFFVIRTERKAWQLRHQ